MESQETNEPEDLRHALRPVAGRDELNLAEFPITVLSDRVPKGCKTLVFEDEVYDQQAKEVVTRKLTITGSDAYGLPTAVDDEILVALIQLTKLANNFSAPEVHFTRYEIVRLLGWPDSGESYRRIEGSLRRWLGVSLYYDNAWWNKVAQSWVSEDFHILENVSILDKAAKRRLKARGQQELRLSSFTWNKVVFQSFQAENLKRLDTDTYFNLSSSVAKRMFRFLDKRFYHRRRWEFELREFAFEHIGLSRGYSDNGKIKEKLQPAIDELTEIGFLEPMSREERYAKVGRGQWRIALVQKAPPVVAERVRAAEPLELETSLVARGMTPATAAELVAAFPKDHIEPRIEAFDWLLDKKDKRVSKNPGGFLADSIRKSYTAPKGFESKAESKRRVEAEREQRRQAEEARRRAEAQERAREEAEQARIRAYWEARSPSEQEALKAEALAETNPFILNLYKKNRGAHYLKMILDTHIANLLDGQEAATREQRTPSA
ncbi:MAG: plasmid replication initiator TrfA [Singulisphaera sp.]